MKDNLRHFAAIWRKLPGLQGAQDGRAALKTAGFLDHFKGFGVFYMNLESQVEAPRGDDIYPLFLAVFNLGAVGQEAFYLDIKGVGNIDEQLRPEGRGGRPRGGCRPL